MKERLPVICRAVSGDLPIVQRLLTGSARWMHSRGWTAWPPDGFPASRITPGIDAGEVWLLLAEGRAVGTLTLDQRFEREFTAPEAEAAGVTEKLPEAWVGHRLAVDRAARGMYGRLLIDWSVDWTSRHGGAWRLTNVARRATPLQDWYRQQGFAHMATVTSTRKDDGTPRQSGYLMGRPVHAVPGMGDRLVEIC